jgi:hypothetical protein
MNEPLPSLADVLERTVTATRRTPRAVSLIARRRDTGLVFSITSLGYLLVYLWLLQTLFVGTGYGFGVEVVGEPLDRLFRSGPGTYGYEAVARIDLGRVRLLFSPLNTAIGGGVAILVGANLTLSYLATVQPRSCGIGAGTGLVASIPAFVTGGTCCAPVLLIALGVTASTTLLSLLSWLLPVGVALLVGSLVSLAGQIDPTVVD